MPVFTDLLYIFSFLLFNFNEKKKQSYILFYNCIKSKTRTKSTNHKKQTTKNKKETIQTLFLFLIYILF